MGVAVGGAAPQTFAHGGKNPRAVTGFAKLLLCINLFSNINSKATISAVQWTQVTGARCIWLVNASE